MSSIKKDIELINNIKITGTLKNISWRNILIDETNRQSQLNRTQLLPRPRLLIVWFIASAFDFRIAQKTLNTSYNQRRLTI